MLIQTATVFPKSALQEAALLSVTLKRFLTEQELSGKQLLDGEEKTTAWRFPIEWPRNSIHPADDSVSSFYFRVYRGVLALVCITIGANHPTNLFAPRLSVQLIHCNEHTVPAYWC